MADIAVTSSMYTSSYRYIPGLVWTSTLIGYWVYYDSNFNWYIYKTTDGGQTWSIVATIIDVDYPSNLSIWYDRWAPGDVGTNIHIAFWGYTSPGTTYDGLRYWAFDTATDTFSTSGVAINTIDGQYGIRMSIAKAIGGNLYIAATLTRTAAGGGPLHYFYRSIDNGATWTSRDTTFTEEDATRNVYDYFRLVPGNEVDTQDMWMGYANVITDAISFKVYDDSGNTWSSTAVDSTGIALTGAENFIPLVASIRHSDNHMILAFCSRQHNATGDIRIYDITNSASIVAKTDVVTDYVMLGLGITIDQNTDDLYVMYGDSSGGLASIIVYYKKSTDGGTSWGAAVQVNATNRAFFAVQADISVYDGRLEPIFYDSVNNDAYVNYDSSFALEAAPPTTPVLKALFCRGDEIQVVFSAGVAYRSPDFGTTWYTISGMIGEDITGVGFDHLNPQNSFFGGDGELWTFDHADGEIYYYVAGVAILGAVTKVDCDLDSGVSVIGTDQTLYKSPDFGETVYEWKALPVTDVGIGVGKTVT